MTRSRSPILRIWAHRNYAFLMGGMAPSLLASWMQRVGVGWLAWELTHSPGWLGAIAAADFAPMLVLAPLAGAVADRGHPLRQMQVAQGLILAQALALAALTFAGRMTIELLFALALLLGCLQPFSVGARHAVVPSTVPREHFATAIALDSAIFQTSRFIGPAIAGILIPTVGVGGTFAAYAVGIAVFLGALFCLDLPPPQRKAHQQAHILQDVKEGLAYVRGHPGIWPVFLLLSVVSVLIRPLQDMLPGFAGGVFQAGATGLAWLTASLGVGATISATWIATRGHVAGLARVFVVGCLGVGLATLGFVATTELWVALIFGVLSGFTLNAMSTSTQALVQSAVADHMRGRVMSLYTVTFRGTPAIGAVGLGLLAERFGLRLTFAAAGVACLAAWAIAAPRHRTLAAALETDPRRIASSEQGRA
jgi:MFS family permease